MTLPPYETSPVDGFCNLTMPDWDGPWLLERPGSSGSEEN